MRGLTIGASARTQHFSHQPNSLLGFAYAHVGSKPGG